MFGGGAINNLIKFLFIALVFTFVFSFKINADLIISNKSFISVSDTKSQGSISLEKIGVLSFNEENADGNIIVSLSTDDPQGDAENIISEIIGGVYNYPNPVRQTESTKIGYELSKDMDVEILMYNSRGDLIFSMFFNAGTVNGSKGGSSNYNKVDLRENGLDIASLPVGIYFYVIRTGDLIIGKGRMAVVP